MKTMKILFHLFFLASLICAGGCSKDSDSPRIGNDLNLLDMNTSISFRVFDEDGNDLLDPSVKGHYEASDIDIVYYDADGNLIIYEDTSTTVDRQRKGRWITSDGKGGVLQLSLVYPEEVNEAIAETYVRFGNGGIDVFKAEYWVGGIDDPNMDVDNFALLKVWHNGTLIKSNEQPSAEKPIIIKKPK